MRKVFVSVLAVISTLVVVPSVLAALSSLALSAHRSNTGTSSPTAGRHRSRSMLSDYESAYR